MEGKLQHGNSLYESPKLDVVLLNTVDVVRTSNPDPNTSVPEAGTGNNNAWFD